MNNFREVNQNDFKQIKKLYRDLLDFNISKEFYDYFFKVGNKYCSRVCTVNEEIVGHNAIIPKQYKIDGQLIKVGLCSGGMVNPDFSGVFFNLLRQGIKKFDGNAIIAFPNQNSQPFFVKLLDFEIINKNYFTLKKSDLNLEYSESHISNMYLTQEFLKKRIDYNPIHNYYRKLKNDTFIIYKNYNYGIDLIYVSALNSDLIIMLKELFDCGCKEINFIYGESNKPLSIGFKKKNNNDFVYKWLDDNLKTKKFNCQMIDSDIF